MLSVHMFTKFVKAYWALGWGLLAEGLEVALFHQLETGAQLGTGRGSDRGGLRSPREVQP